MTFLMLYSLTWRPDKPIRMNLLLYQMIERTPMAVIEADISFNYLLAFFLSKSNRSPLPLPCPFLTKKVLSLGLFSAKLVT
jgi:hypothetical protein